MISAKNQMLSICNAGLLVPTFLYDHFNRIPPALCLAVSWAGTLYTHFGDSCPLTELCQVENSLCVHFMPSHILAALLHGTRAVGVRQTLRSSAEGATYIRQGGITLHIGPHCSIWSFQSYSTWTPPVGRPGCIGPRSVWLDGVQPWK